MTTLFWIALAFVAYTYAGYPLAVWLLARLRPVHEPTMPPDVDWPELTVVIAVHNEASRVQAKVDNLRALDYPAGRARFLFVSDGSTDDTVARLRALPDVTLVECPVRGGKPRALNAALLQVRTPLVVFADVRQRIEPGALKHLVRRLLQPGIGAVSGELVHVQPGTETAANIGLYWRYEKWIRKSEAAIASTVGATGALYAMRTEHYTPLADDTILDDFEQPMAVVRRGLRVVFESEARLYDELQTDMGGERKRKVRTLTGNFQSFARHPWLFSPRANPLWIQFLSHKVFRLLVPYALGVLLVAPVFIDGAVYSAFLAAELAFYGAAWLGSRFEGLRRARLVSFAGVFVEMNWAAVQALRAWLAGGVNARWEKT
jgi:cellulose synthase/poly-beta-1,6-N-acetylglucosamine synthase-like glycosyltransferase